MEFKNNLFQLSQRAEQMRDHLKSEEATKTAIIMPFFSILGYDVFNPREFLPEYTSDFGLKKGEKVDYAIMIDENPVILIEAKPYDECLEKYDSQLCRYFSAKVAAKFGILTNGIIYKFYTDLEEKNVMDKEPFFEFNLLSFKDNAVSELKKFRKSSFNMDTILNTAEELKYKNLIKELLKSELAAPKDEFVNYVLGKVYDKKRTQAAIERFGPIVQQSFNEMINEQMEERLKSAIYKKEDIAPEESSEVILIEPEKEIHAVTTADELGAFYIIRAILQDTVDPTRLFYKDTSNYFTILVDNKTTKWICRLFLQGHKKSIQIPDENKIPERYELTSVNDIQHLKDKLEESVKKYL